MFTKLTKSIGLSVVAGLTPFLLAVSPVAAQTSMPVNAVPSQGQAAQASASQPGTSVATAGAPMSGWVTISANATQWYKFNYHYDNSTVVPAKKGQANYVTPSQAMVKLTMDNAGAVSFAVWTPGSLQNPVHDPKDMLHGRPDHTNDKIQPIGYGTPADLGTLHSYLDYQSNTNIVGQNQTELRQDVPSPLELNKGTVLNPQVLTWTTSDRTSDTFYVAVTNKTNAPAHYQLSISGATVSY